MTEITIADLKAEGYDLNDSEVQRIIGTFDPASIQPIQYNPETSPFPKEVFDGPLIGNLVKALQSQQGGFYSNLSGGLHEFNNEEEITSWLRDPVAFSAREHDMDAARENMDDWTAQLVMTLQIARLKELGEVGERPKDDAMAEMAYRMNNFVEERRREVKSMQMLQIDSELADGEWEYDTEIEVEAE